MKKGNFLKVMQGNYHGDELQAQEVGSLRLNPHVWPCHIASRRESALLGGMIQNPEGLTRVASIDPAAFYDPFHADVYRAIQRLCSKGHPVEPAAVHVELRAHGVEAELMTSRASQVLRPAPRACACTPGPSLIAIGCASSCRLAGRLATWP